MSLQLLKADTSDALTLNGISKRAFDSDVFVGGASAGSLLRRSISVRVTDLL